ncbi:MAG TPA: MBL fold metallo-hydrolase [Phycisphaerae bacterium]|nr:MBL fold metallo-hydrolase [Phycisphaerae bacterium]
MSGIDPADEPKILTVGEGLCVRQEVDNIAWIDLGGQAVVVDALERPELENEVFAAIRQTLGETPVRTVLNTHTHYDHTALNAALERTFGAEIINQRTSRVGAEGRWFEGSRRRLQWLAMPGCHTAEDCVAWVPEDRALFVGDIFGWGLIPLSGALTGQTARLLLETHQRLIDFDPAVVIPGHGPLGTRETLERWVAYFHWLRARCAEAVAAGKSDGQVLAEVAPPEDMKGWWRFVAWKHEDSLGKVLRAVRGGQLEA